MDNLKEEKQTNSKKVVYQVFTRLFGNTKTTNKPWGTIEENGVGKFVDFTDKALHEIKDLGVTHIWYTGVPHHALVNDYTQYGISNDDPEVVKGRAGSPYAVKDYYNVNPDLAVDPAHRLDEFKQLVERTHKAGLKVIIDIVPNHVARKYKSISAPNGVEGFGVLDDTSVTYKKDNNFYYNPNEAFKLPEWKDGYLPLGGEKNALIDGKFDENPAKWTGNGARASQPDQNDWYETVKVNYGISSGGQKDFDTLPNNFDEADYKLHYEFWQDKEVLDSWKKFKDIALYWLDVGVDGFRYDMAEMVPVEFWSYMNSAIKTKNPDAFLMAEVYNPDLYRAYIRIGKMDYLYDKVDMYDSIKHIMKGYGWTDHIPVVRNKFEDIELHMLYFLENHDEQRIASPQFVGKAETAKPAMTVLTTIGTSPIMIYFGQEVGEPGAEDAGFGKPSRTSIFDYIGVPHHQRWMNNGKFDGGQLSKDEKALRDFYKRLLNIAIHNEAIMGESREIHYYNKEHTNNYNHRVFSFVRYTANEKLIVVSNFDEETSYEFALKIPKEIIREWKLNKENYILTDLLYGDKNNLSLRNDEGTIKIRINPLQSFIFEVL
ncbi:alpha-amylase family protein [Galbibacter pacificus]|uniref:Alpha-amylase family protein n=1 Tax=Galbibacter pacificus TaxID=2996052 RepID=A0ABT6FWC5_9FLAO|nr:alpha-amylase family protein [Galbibacter pacificus]MDG3584002.1 alpha-amylase family protein [Galbibacter pacificus]MDG3587561.1 alpha-amylase family protein [Galbibacter pacificus]